MLGLSDLVLHYLVMSLGGISQHTIICVLWDCCGASFSFSLTFLFSGVFIFGYGVCTDESGQQYVMLM